MSPPSADSVLAKQPSLTRAGGAQATSAANEVLVPNKSMLVEEDVDPRSTSPPDAGNISGRGIQEGPDSPNGNQTYFSGRGSEGSSLAGGFIGRYINQQNGANDTNRGGPNLDRERQAWKIEKEQEIEKVRSDYEYQLTQLRNQLSDARRQAVDNVETANSRMEGRLRETDQDLREQRKRGEEQASQIRAYERDLAEMQERVNASDNLQAEVEELRAKIEMQAGSHDASDDIISELKAEVQGLLDELSSANQRLDAVSSERDMETDKVRTLESDLESWRTKYNQLQSRQQGSFSGRGKHTGLTPDHN